MTSPNRQFELRRLLQAYTCACGTLLVILVSAIARAQYYDPVPPEPRPPAPAPPSTQSAYVATPLVSNGAIAGTTVDANLVNPWGIALVPDGPMWVVNNATQTATVYDGTGAAQPIVVRMPGGINGPAAPTGIVFNPTPDFVVNNGVAAATAQFIFAGEGGTILAWAPAIDPANAIIVHDDGAGGAVYKGLAIATENGTSLLYAADFLNNRIDVFDRAFQKVSVPGGFLDPALPAGYAPFGIQAISRAGQTLICVTYAQRAPDSIEDVPGPGLGTANLFDTRGTLVQRLVPPGGNLNAPWAVALAPADFGALSNALLIANFGDGAIHAYDPNTGAFIATLADANGQPIVTEGLWGIAFGNGAHNQPANTLYYAAGIAGETAGVYGRIDVVP